MLIWQKELRFLIFALILFISVGTIISGFFVIRLDGFLMRFFKIEFMAETEMVKYFLDKEMPIIELPSTPLVGSITSCDAETTLDKDEIMIRTTTNQCYRITPDYTYLNQARMITRLYFLFIIITWVSVLILSFFFSRRVLVKRGDLRLPGDQSQSLNQFVEEAITKIREEEEVINNMATMVTHELKNSLSAILGLVRVGKIDQNKLSDEINSMLEFLDRVSLFTRPVQIKTALIRLNDLIKDIINDFKDSCEVEFYFSTQEEISISTDLVLLDHILRNIIKNSLEELEKRGKIEIELTKSGEDILISVIDNGPGIEETNLAKIFKPFYTTKPDGTGLGLSIVKRFVEALDGKISVTSSKGGGTRITITLRDARHADN